MNETTWTTMPVDDWDKLFTKLQPVLAVVSRPDYMVAMLRHKQQPVHVMRLDYEYKTAYVNPEGVKMARHATGAIQ